MPRLDWRKASLNRRNNAGIDGAHALGWEADIAAWQKVIEVNLFGAFNCPREALKRMVPRKSGVVLNTTSGHEEIAWSGYSAYTASKAAVGMLTRTLAQEAAPFGVRVLAVGPGAIKTPINQAVWSDPASLKDLLEKTPLDRIGAPEEVARMVVVLVSEVSSYVTRSHHLCGWWHDRLSRLRSWRLVEGIHGSEEISCRR